MARSTNPPTRRFARCARSERLRRPAAVLERARGGELLVFGGRRPVADLRRQPHRQLRARLAVHARHVSRGFPIRNPGFLAKRAPRSGARRSGRICYRNDSFKKNLQGAELLQLLATFALVLIIRDAALWAWGPEDRLGPRAPGLAGAVTIAGGQFPQYDLLLICLGPAV